MPCPICHQKPANCDCTAPEKQLFAEIEELTAEVEELTAEVEQSKRENARLRGLCGLAPDQPIPDLMS